MTRSKILFRICWTGCAGGTVTALPLLVLLYSDVVHPRYWWVTPFWTVLTVGFIVLGFLALRAEFRKEQS